ncbi:hypothetical protein ACIP5Y_15590 [Nocardia sp. NPDC088792]|uniref:hypothetical protein n=1 Tax=Nocardia sp. NPDC088792 TaxID=3364332 RepID=UPI003822F13D
MSGNNLLTASSIAPQVLVSQQLSNIETVLYSPTVTASAKITQGTLTNVSNQLTPTLTLGSLSGGGTLAAGTYFWVVTAVSAAGESLASNEVSAVVGSSVSSVQLSWAPVGGAVSYNIYRGTAAGGENIKFTATGTSFIDTGAAGAAQVPPTASAFGQAVKVYVSLVKSGGTVTDGTHRVINAYNLNMNDTLSLAPYIGNAMLGPGDGLAAFASFPGCVDMVVTGAVNS